MSFSVSAQIVSGPFKGLTKVDLFGRFPTEARESPAQREANPQTFTAVYTVFSPFAVRPVRVEYD